MSSPNTYPCPYHQYKCRSSQVSSVETVRNAHFAFFGGGTKLLYLTIHSMLISQYNMVKKSITCTILTLVCEARPAKPGRRLSSAKTVPTPGRSEGYLPGRGDLRVTSPAGERCGIPPRRSERALTPARAVKELAPNHLHRPASRRPWWSGAPRADRPATTAGAGHGLARMGKGAGVVTSYSYSQWVGRTFPLIWPWISGHRSKVIVGTDFKFSEKV